MLCYTTRDRKKHKLSKRISYYGFCGSRIVINSIHFCIQAFTQIIYMLNLGTLCSFQTIQNPLIAKRPLICQCKVCYESSELNSEPSVLGEGAQEGSNIKSIQKMFVKLNQFQIPRDSHHPVPSARFTAMTQRKKPTLTHIYQMAALLQTHQYLHICYPAQSVSPAQFFGIPALGKECRCSGWTHSLELTNCCPDPFSWTERNIHSSIQGSLIQAKNTASRQLIQKEGHWKSPGLLRELGES